MASRTAFLGLLLLLGCSAQVSLGALGTLGTEDGGSCGYVNYPAVGVLKTGFSQAIYGAGSVCGGCYLVSCQGSQQCKAGRVLVTVTNECMAQNATSPCTVPRAALNLQPAAFDVISASRAPGIVGITYTPTPCIRNSGIQFYITTGNQYYMAVLIQNVGGPGALAGVQVKAGAQALAPMTRSYGAVWEVRNYILAGALSFHLTGYNGQVLFVRNAIPANWKPQVVYTAPVNYNWPPVARKVLP